MGKKIERVRSKTLPSSPTHSFSSDFEFRISISPRKSSVALCPADELFYKGQLLPLHLSPRISMVRTLLLASSSTSSSSDTTTTASRDSSSSIDSTSSSFAADLAPGDPCCDSSRPSSATDLENNSHDYYHLKQHSSKKSSSSSKFNFSLSRFSNVFKKDNSKIAATSDNNNNKKMSSSAKEVIRKYLNKVRPLYDKLSSKDRRRTESTAVLLTKPAEADEPTTQSFSGNLNCPKMIRRSYAAASCPASMRSSPSHSGVLTRAGLPMSSYGSGSDTSTMEELQNAIQGAIAHCKNSMVQSSSSSFNVNNNHMYNCSSNSKGKGLLVEI